MGTRLVVALLITAGILIHHATFCDAGPLMALDLGGESLRVSIVKPSKTPISVVLNEASKRKTSAQLAFVDGVRSLGDDAAALSVKHPDKVFSRVRDLLGKQADSSDVEALLTSYKLPYKVVPAADGRAAIKTDDNIVHPAEELVASLIHLAREMTEASADGSAIIDCVITVPAFWGPAQRQALLDAAKIADINVMALVNTHAAAALQYGIERDFKDKSSLVVFYDMGATSTVTALVKFSSFSIKEGGSTKTYGQFEVLDVAWDATLGGELLDLVLIDHFASEFADKNPGLDPRSSPKALAKLRKAVKRTKEVLSANSFAPISVEELINGLDLRSKIERAEFEKLAAGFLERVAGPLTELLKRNSMAVKDLDAVELLGGGSRVPAVKAALVDALGGRPLDMHLNADEAVVLGAGLFAANLSTSFKLRKFGMKDGITYPITIQLKHDKGKLPDASSESYFQPRALLPRMKALPVRRLVPLPSDLEADELLVELSFNTSDPTVGLPPGVSSPTLAKYRISGIQEARKKHNDTGKLSLHVKADESGIISLERAESLAETIEEYTVKVPINGPGLGDIDPQMAKKLDPKILDLLKNSKDKMADLDKALNEQNAKQKAQGESIDTEPDVGKAGENDTQPSTPPAPQFKDVVKTRKKTLRQPLVVTDTQSSFQALKADALKDAKKTLERLAKEESARREASRLKNELEAYILAFSSRISDDEDVAAVTTSEQRSDFSDQLLKAEDWLYSDGEDEQSANVFRAKKAELEGVGGAIQLRVRELKLLPKALKNAQSFLKNARQTIDSWKSTKPWLNETEVENLKNQVQDTDEWLISESAKQEKRQRHEKAVLVSADIDSRLDALRRPFTVLKNKKKPKPPPAPKKAQNSTSSESAEAAEEEENKIRQEEDREKPPSEGTEDGATEQGNDHTEL